MGAPTAQATSSLPPPPAPSAWVGDWLPGGRGVPTSVACTLMIGGSFLNAVQLARMRVWLGKLGAAQAEGARWGATHPSNSGEWPSGGDFLSSPRAPTPDKPHPAHPSQACPWRCPSPAMCLPWATRSLPSAVLTASATSAGGPRALCATSRPRTRTTWVAGLLTSCLPTRSRVVTGLMPGVTGGGSWGRARRQPPAPPHTPLPTAGQERAGRLPGARAAGAQRWR